MTRVAIDLPGLKGPSGFSVLITRLQHNFRVSFEPHKFGADFVIAITQALARDESQLDSFHKRVTDMGNRIDIRCGGANVMTDRSLLPVSRDPVSGLMEQQFTFEIAGPLSDSDNSQFEESRPIAAALELLSFVCGLLPNLKGSDSDLEVESIPEGAAMSIKVNRYERDPAVRRACISIFGHKCQICGFDFEEKFGELGRGFIEIHHIVPLSSGGGKQRDVDPSHDVIPVCSNCHSMIHRGGTTRSPAEVRKQIREQ